MEAVVRCDSPSGTGESVTCGSYADETAACSAFDLLVEKTGMFKIHKEIWGDLIQPRTGCEQKRMKIDRILSPKNELIALGWTHGPIGVELKRSGVKIGPPLSQALDYCRTAWEMPGGYRIVLNFSFLFPVEKQHGTVASIMAQQRIGTISSTKWNPLSFCVGECVAIRFDEFWNVTMNKVDCGRKAGSR